MKLKCLIVDDDHLSRILLARMLSAHAECEFASDGEEAMRLLIEDRHVSKRYDLVFLDIMLPKVDGHTILREVRLCEARDGISALAQLKVIMTSSLENCDNVLTAYQNGCGSYVAKPFDRKRILTEMSKFDFDSDALNARKDENRHLNDQRLH